MDYGRDGEEGQVLGLLHLVNKIGFSSGFEVDDLFVSIMVSQSSSIIQSIHDKAVRSVHNFDLHGLKRNSTWFEYRKTPNCF